MMENQLIDSSCSMPCGLLVSALEFRYLQLKAGALPSINIPDYVYRKSMAFLPFMLHDSTNLYSVCTYTYPLESGLRSYFFPLSSVYVQAARSV